MSGEPIAIVGSSCRFPGNANTPAKLWQMLRAPPDLLQKIPDTRFSTEAFYHPNGKRMGCTNTDKAYLLSEPIDRFDATFFNINPREAEAIDPQQKMLLEVVFEALESAGFTLEDMRGSDTCVFVGSMTGDYAELAHQDPDSMPQYMATGTASSIISNRVSYFFDWKGPSVTIDTACSSSLVAVHQAVQTLRNGESNIAVAGGSNLILSPDMFISESKLQMLSPTGRSRMWDADADGYARGEGFAAILLKRLSDAIADGDRIECIIRETGVNQDGRTQGITMPSATSQTALIRKTYERAGLDWRSPIDRCQYFEAHGTGTQAGDAIEAQGVAEAFFEEGNTEYVTDTPLYVGSIKTATGHLEGCAGLAGLLKSSLALQNAAIPPNLHFKRLNPKLKPYYQHVEIPTSLREWPSVAGNGCRRASVNSFGFGGTNAHVILESPDRAVTASANGITNGLSQTLLTTPIILSAMSDHSLAEAIRSTRDFLIENPTMDLENLAWNLQTKRSQFPLRVAFSGTTHDTILGQMTALIEQNDQSKQSAVGTRFRSKASPRILAIFTGQGAQWATMGRELLLRSEVFSSTIQSLDDSLQQLRDPPSWSIRDELLKEDSLSRLGEAEIAQPLCTAVQIALLDLAAVANITPDAAIGHSSGEIAAAYASGAITARDAVRIAYYRGVHTKLARGASGQKGAMMAVGVSFEEAEKFCSRSEFIGRINVAAANSPSSVTLAGDQDAISEAKAKFDAEGNFARALKVDKAYHSPHMFPCSEPYRESLRACGVSVQKPADSCIWYSSVHRRLMNDENEVYVLKADYWVDNMVSPVLFTHALGEVFRNQQPFDLALEFGPHSALKGPVLQTAKEILSDALPYQGMLTRGLNDMDAFSTALGSIWSQIGLPPSSFNAYRRTMTNSKGWTPRFLSNLPGYQWDHRQSFWHESRISKNYRFGKHPRHDLLGRPSNENTALNMKWRNILRLEDLPWLRGHRVQGEPIFPAAAYIVMALEASKQLVRDQKIAMLELLDIRLVASIDLEEDSRVGREIQFTIKTTTNIDKHRETNVLEADFACYSCVDHHLDTWEENVSGRVRVILDDSESWSLPKRSIEEHSLANVNISSFYDVMDEIGLNYSGLFRGLTSIRRKMGFAAATAALSEDNEHSSDMMIHPALLDSCFQTLFAAYSWPGDASIRSPFVPTKIDRICISSVFVNSRRKARNDVFVDAYLTASSSTAVAADLDITSSSSEDISIRIENLAATCLIFSQTVWDSPTDVPEDLQQIEICERLAYYFLRRLKKEIAPQEITTMKWHYQRLFEFTEYLFPRPEWANDTYEQLLTTAEIPALEVMLENNMLDRIYNRFAQQITHRNADMNILEVGAGTGGHSFSSYTFSDISAGFFENAQIQFKDYSKGDLAEQGYEDHSFDAIIASNVLHATKTLDKTLRNVRLTSEILRIKLMMSGLPGWWLGGDDGRRFAPTISKERWDSLLRATGFSGHMTSVMVSQAIDDHVSFLRSPLTAPGYKLPGDVLVVGGTTSRSKITSQSAQVKVLPVLEDITSVDLARYSTVLCMTELDGPIFKSITQDRLSALQTLFGQARHVVEVGDSARYLRPGQQVLALSTRNASTIETPADWVFPCMSTASIASKLQSCAMNLVASQFDFEGKTTLLIHEPDPLTTPHIVDIIKSRGITVVCTTTNPESAKQYNWIHLQPQSTDRVLREAVPSDVDIFWDESVEPQTSRVGARIRKALSGQVVAYSLEDFRKEQAYLESRLPTFEISHRFSFACRDMAGINGIPGRKGSEVSVEEVWDLPSLSGCVLSWPSDNQQMAVRVQPADFKTLFRSDKTYLLVGCTGGLGLSLCRWMAKNGARYLVLTSRRPEKVDPRWSESIRRMGVKIDIMALDISERQSLNRVYDEIRQNYPAVAGVANAAMVLEDRMFSSMSLETLTKVLGPKVDGSRYLDELFGSQPLDFFVFFSSTASVVGNRGQSNYAAANLYMVGLANNRRKRGLAASVIDIGMVLGVGYITDNGIYESVLKKHNLMPISESEFHNMFAEAVIAGRPGSGKNIQLTTGLHRASRSEGEDQPFWSNNPRFSHFVKEEDAETVDPQSSAQIVPVRQLLQAASTPEEHEQILEESFLSKLGRILQVPSDAIDNSIPLVNLGVDSLMAVEVRTWFIKEVDVDISVLKVLGGACLRKEQETTGSQKAESVSTDDQKPTIATPESTTQASGDEEETSSADETTPSHFTRVERMSFAQSRLWFLIQYVDDPTTYNVTISYKVTGSLRVNDLRDAFQRVIQRHESLRTCFFLNEATGETMQAILPTAKFDIEVVKDRHVDSAIAKVRNNGYALDQGETLKALLVVASPSESYLILGFNHIILDSFSAQILIQEVQRIYTSPFRLVLPSPPQYIEFAVRQRLQVENGEMASNINFWKSEYLNFPPALPLLPFALVKTRKALRRYDTHSVQAQIDASSVERIAQFSKASKSTTFSFYLTTLQVLLFKLLGTSDVCIGISDANRAEKESLGVIGFLVNLLPLRLRSSAQETFINTVNTTTTKVQSFLAHSRVPFDVLLDELAVSRTARESPMFQVLLDYQKGPAPELVLGEGRAELHTMQDVRNGIDLTFEIKEIPGKDATVTIRSQQYLYDHQGLRLLLDCYAHLLEAASASPQAKLQQLSPFSQRSVDRALAVSGQQQKQLALNEQSATVAERIGRVIHQHPSDIALKDGLGNSLSYADLGSRAGIIAAELDIEGVKPGDHVVVCCEPTFDFIASILAIHLVGAVYVPIEVRNPPHRIEAIFRECQPVVVIYDHTTRDTLESLGCYDGPVLDLSTVEFASQNGIGTSSSLSKPESIAYVLYTSGSTGTPKGVLVTHSNLVCQLDAMRSACNLGCEVVLQQASVGFDASIDQIFAALAFGGTLILVPSSIRGDAHEIAKLMAENEVTMTQMTPSECTALITYGLDWMRKCKSFRFAFCGGEAFTPALRQQFSKLALPELSVYNRYGPTEITVSAALYKVPLNDNAERIPCGPSLPNYAIYILDENLNPLPLGYPGEICVGGGGVARGYLNNEAANKAKFIPSPHATPELRQLGWDRSYRTGDKGFVLDDGTMVYLGRIDGDSQVKIHGRRIELDEIANVLLSTSGGSLTDAAVMLRKVDGDKEVLCAAVTFAPGQVPEETDRYFKNLSSRLALPEYMRPTRWAAVESLPRNHSGKLDWNSLNGMPTPERLHDEAQEPLSDDEAKLAKIWSEALSDDAPVSSSSDFFELGGNSILLLRLQYLLRDRLGEAPRLADLFANSTLKSMAAVLAPENQTIEDFQIDWDAESSLPPLASTPFPLSAIKKENLDVVLTGATGFLGSAVLQRLIKNPQIAHIRCIAIRNESALTELSKRSPKIIPYKGDLRQANLGLAPSEFTHLLQTADLIIHNAAEVSFLKTYNSLRAPNVTSTKALIQMAAPRKISFHFISTGGVARLVPGGKLSKTSIAAFPPNATTGGYVASKWVSERVLERAAESFGIPVHIHRPASITGPNAPVTDIMLNVLHYSAKLKAVPAVGDAATAAIFDFVPVDSIAGDVTDSAFRGEQQSKYVVSHHCSEKKLSLEDLKMQMEQQQNGDDSLPWKTLSIEEWTRKAVRAGMPELVGEMIESVLKRQSQTMAAFPILVKG
ncbi:hypothetical protein BDV06DRAFT_233408 [Aspergillus oleicola]